MPTALLISFTSLFRPLFSTVKEGKGGARLKREVTCIMNVFLPLNDMYWCVFSLLPSPATNAGGGMRRGRVKFLILIYTKNIMLQVYLALS